MVGLFFLTLVNPAHVLRYGHNRYSLLEFLANLVVKIWARIFRYKRKVVYFLKCEIYYLTVEEILVPYHNITI